VSMLLIYIGFKSREPRIPGAPVISFNYYCWPWNFLQ